MAGFTLTKRVNAPSEIVFEVFTDLEHAPQNTRGIERLELLTPGPIGEGTRFRETRIMMKKEATEEIEITHFRPGSSYTAVCESCGCRCEFTFCFLPDGSATDVELNASWRATSLVARLMTPLSWLMLGTMKKCTAQDMDDLKSVAEARVK